MCIRQRINKKAVFIGELFPHDDETLVHPKVIPPGFGKFEIKTVFARRALAWQKYDRGIHYLDSLIIWDKLETRNRKQHEIPKPNVASPGTIPNGATEVENGRVRKRLRHDADHLSSQRKERCDRGLSWKRSKKVEKGA